MEEFVELGAVAGHDLGVVAWQLGQQEETKHAALAVAAEWHARFGGCTCQSVHQALCTCTQSFVKARFGNFAQGGQATRGGHRVAAQRACLVHRAGWSQLRHDGARTTKGRQRHAAANDFAQNGHIRFEARNELGVNALGAAERNAESRHDFVKYKQCAVLSAQLAAAFHERHARTHKVHIARDGFDHHAGQFFAVQCKGFFELRDVVVLQHQGVAHHFRRHARAGGVAKGGEARTCFDQQSIAVAVVAAFKLDELAAACGATRQAQGAHACFGA